MGDLDAPTFTPKICRSTAFLNMFDGLWTTRTLLVPSNRGLRIKAFRVEGYMVPDGGYLGCIGGRWEDFDKYSTCFKRSRNLELAIRKYLEVAVKLL